jgi:hypothetical protein
MDPSRLNRTMEIGGPTNLGVALTCASIARFSAAGKFLLIEGQLQNQENVISVKADVVRPPEISEVDVRSHDFH